MSRTGFAPRWGIRAGMVGLIALALAVLVALTLAPRAGAAFTTAKCAGPDVTGRGASFARDAHTVFNFNFKNNFCIGTPGFGLIEVTYEPQGSGAGRTAMKDRTLAPRFGMSDEAPSPTDVAQMNAGITAAGPDPNTADNGKVHVVPAAVGAVAPLVNFPDSCDVNRLPAAAKTAEQNKDGDATPDDVIRVRFTKTQFDKIWAKDSDADTWTEVFPDLRDATTHPDPATDPCVKPIVRIVRFDESGTSFAFKDYLDTINGARGWLTDFGSAGTGGTRRWPGTTFGDRDDCGDNDGIAEAADPDGPGAPGFDGTPGVPADTDQLTSGCSNGNGALVTTLINTDGSIGYSDISTARNASQSLAITPEANDNDTYWTQIPNGSDVFTEPTADAFGFRSDGLKGSNCQVTTFTDVPDDTFGDWSQTSGVNSPAGYGICTFTYGLLFDDNADAWGNTVAEEGKARTVKDYWLNVLSDGAQGQLFGNDYAPLPQAIQTLAQNGVAQIDWNKGTGGGGGNNNPPPPPPPPGGNEPPPANPPSNKFSVPRTTISSKTGAATLSVKLPGAGKLELVGSAKSGKKKIKVGRVVLTANKSGTFKLTLKPSKAAKRLLRSKGKLKVTLKLTFTPKGGTAKSSTKTVTLKLKKQGRG
jgi:ABC-type phosphate transport system substrate-binding protein